MFSFATAVCTSLSLAAFDNYKSHRNVACNGIISVACVPLIQLNELNGPKAIISILFNLLLSMLIEWKRLQFRNNVVLPRDRQGTTQ